MGRPCRRAPGAWADVALVRVLGIAGQRGRPRAGAGWPGHCWQPPCGSPCGACWRTADLVEGAAGTEERVARERMALARCGPRWAFSAAAWRLPGHRRCWPPPSASTADRHGTSRAVCSPIAKKSGLPGLHRDIDEPSAGMPKWSVAINAASLSHRAGMRSSIPTPIRSRTDTPASGGRSAGAARGRYRSSPASPPPRTRAAPPAGRSSGGARVGGQPGRREWSPTEHRQGQGLDQALDHDAGQHRGQADRGPAGVRQRPDGRGGCRSACAHQRERAARSGLAEPLVLTCLPWRGSRQGHGRWQAIWSGGQQHLVAHGVVHLTKSLCGR
jgi:hypothetical protein